MQQHITIQNLKSQLYDLIKGQTHVEWRNVSRNGKTFKRRYRVKNQEDQHEVREHSITGNKLAFGGDSSNSAALKDAVIHGHYYNNEFYNNKGEKIPLNPSQLQEAIKLHQSGAIHLPQSHPDYKKSVKQKGERFKQEVLPLIEKKNELYDKVKSKHEAQHKSIFDWENRKRNVSTLMSGITSSTNYNKLLEHLESVSRYLTTDPLISVKRQNKPQTEIYLSEMISSLDKTLSLNTALKKQSANVEKISLLELDELDEEDFTMPEFKPDHKKIYQKVNQLISKENE